MSVAHFCVQSYHLNHFAPVALQVFVWRRITNMRALLIHMVVQSTHKCS